MSIENIQYIDSASIDNLVATGSFMGDASGLIFRTRHLTSNYSLESADYNIVVSGSSHVTINLPTAESIPWKIYSIKNVTRNLVTVTGSQTIDDERSIILNKRDSMTIQSDGTRWYII